jgi:hypothetical protein
VVVELAVLVEYHVVKLVTVDATTLVTRVVDVETVDTTVVVAVPVRRPPNGEKRSIAASSPPRENGNTSGIVSNVLAEPTAHPLLGEIM